MNVKAIVSKADPSDPTMQWHKSACILCSINCGIEVRLDDGQMTRIRGNKDHVASKGYTCEKALRLNHYQNATGRVTSPMRREPDGSYSAVDWDTAITEVVAGLKAIGDTYGQDKVMYYGGGGQGNHLGGAYGAAMRRAFNITTRSNALAQEKTGEAWVDGRMFGSHTHGDFHHAEVAVFLGKNPWQSHGFDEARRVLKEIKADPKRSMIVIDPRVTETVKLADFHLQVKPGTDAYCLAAMGAIIVQTELLDRPWMAANTVGGEELLAALAAVDASDFAQRCGVDEALLIAATQRMASADSVAIFEDLGTQMAPHSTLVSYLEKAIWVLLGSFAKPGAMTTHSAFSHLLSYGASGREPASPVTGSPLISGMVACNEIPEMVLSDHPDRFRAMFIESANPVHSLAGEADWHAVMEELEFSVVVDVAMTETARLASYVLPASSQFEKAEATFFGLAFPDNSVTLRAPILPALKGTLSEAEIHSRIMIELGLINDEILDPLRAAALSGRQEFTEAITEAMMANPKLAQIGAVVLYETLGRSLPDGLAEAAPLWFLAQQCAARYPEAMRAAGFDVDDDALGDALFDAIIESRDGVVFTRHTYEQAWDMLRTPDHKINLNIPELVADLIGLADGPTDHRSNEFPYILSAGERRSFTANTIIRDPAWRKRDAEGALRVSAADAVRAGVETGDRVRVVTAGGAAVAVVEVNDTMMDGHISLPNGYGVDYSPAGGNPEATGVSPNKLTSNDWRDAYAGTPWHKHVPARLERV